MFPYAAVPFAVTLVAIDNVAQTAAVLVVPFLFVVGNLVWGAPFLVVVRDADALDAIAWRASLAASESKYVTFSVGFAVATAVVSLFVSPVLADGGVVPVVVLAVVVAYPALFASAAAIHVVDDTAAPSRTAYVALSPTPPRAERHGPDEQPVRNAAGL